MLRRRSADGKPTMTFYMSYRLAIFSLTVSIVLTLGTMALNWCLKPIDTALYLSEHRQALDDWTSLPFVDLQIVGGNCPQGFESLFHREWPGT